MLFRIFAAFVILRAIYAFVLMLIGMNHATGLFPDYALTGPIGQLISRFSIPVLIGWAIYTSGYLIAAVRFWFRRADAFAIYVCAFLIDLLLWAYSSVSPLYQSVYNGNANQVDIAFNIIDLLIISGMWLYFHRRS